MSALDYLLLFIIGVVGAALHFYLKMGETRKRAKLANVEFFTKQYYEDEKIAIIVSFLTIILALLLAPEAIGIRPGIMEIRKSLLAFIGYFGDSIASKVFGFAGKRLDAAIDDKTTQIDIINNTVENPTPAVMPKDKKV